MSNTNYKPISLLPKVYPKNEHALDIAGGFRIDSISLELQRVKTLANPKSCPVEFLPILAYSFGSDFYWELENLNESEQRAMIANSLQLHRKKGTLWAIEKVLEILGFDIEVIEWWEDKNNPLDINPTKPYTFAVILDVAKFYQNSRILSESEQRRVLKYLDIYKNVRSKFDFYLKTNLQQNLSAVPIAQLTELKTERLESRDYSKDLKNSIGYTNIADIKDTEIRELESDNYKNSSISTASIASSAQLIELKTEELESEDYSKSLENSIGYINIASIRDSAVIPIETEDNQLSDSSVGIFGVSKMRETEIRNFETNPIEKEIENEMKIVMSIKITEVHNV